MEDGEYEYIIVVDIPSLQFTVNSGVTNVSNSLWGGVSVATGDLLSVSSMEESADLGVSSINATMSGLNADLVEDARDLDNVQGLDINIFIAFKQTTEFNRVIEWFRGQIDDMVFVQNGQDIQIQVKATSFLNRFNDANVRRYTKEDHKRFHTTTADRGLLYVESIADQNLVWGE